MSYQKADIKRVGKNIIVTDKKGKTIFSQPRSEQVIAVAHSLYMYEKYESAGRHNK